MNKLRRLAAVSCFLFAQLCAERGSCLELSGLPSAATELGNAFVEAWIGLRIDFDSMANSGVHPQQIAAWFRACPEFAVRDAARLGTHPAVVLAAATELVSRGGAKNREAVARAAAAFEGEPISLELRALSIRAGDQALKRGAVAALSSPVVPVQLEAAAMLALAGDASGLELLRHLALRQGPNQQLAVSLLGRLGTEQDKKLLSPRRGQGPGDVPCAAAQGELELRNRLPEHYALLRVRWAGLDYIAGVSDIYETWLSAFALAVSQGETSPAGLLRAALQQRTAMCGRDSELVQRHLDAMAEFLRDADQTLTSTRPEPRWPATFAEARSKLRSIEGAKVFSAAFAERVSAEIALLEVLSAKLKHDQLAAPSASLQPATPGADRALDGDFTTAWHAPRGGTLSLVREPEAAPVKSIWLAAGCPINDQTPIWEISVTGSASGGEWTEKVALEPRARYFQIVRLKRQRNAERIAIRIEGIGNADSACIAEVRVLP